MLIQTRELQGRRPLSVTSIPWAQPAPAPVNHYPAFFDQRARKRIRFNLARPTLDPVITAGVAPDPFALTGYYPASGLAKGFRIEFDRKALTVPDLNTRPATPAEYYSGHYPGSGLATSFKRSFRIDRLDVPELNRYPATPVPAQPFTAYIPPPLFRRNGWKELLKLPPLDNFPELVDVVIRGSIRGASDIQSLAVVSNIMAITAESNQASIEADSDIQKIYIASNYTVQ